MPQRLGKPQKTQAAMSDCVLDASAVLAVLFQEPGEEIVRPRLRGGLISAVNASAVLSRRFQNGESLQRSAEVLHSLQLRIIDFDWEQAMLATSFKHYAWAANLCFADRACLALGLQRGLPILTAEHNWLKVELGVSVHLIRERKQM